MLGTGRARAVHKQLWGLQMVGLSVIGDGEGGYRTCTSAGGCWGWGEVTLIKAEQPGPQVEWPGTKCPL